MDPSNPQIITHVQKSLNYTLFDAKFVPRSAKFVCVGSKATGSGVIQLYELTHNEMKGDVNLLKDVRLIIMALVFNRLFMHFSDFLPTFFLFFCMLYPEH